MKIIELKSVRKSFYNQTAVNNVSFELTKGSIFGMLGPNGAGKTTLIRMITGIFYPDSGSILFEGSLLDLEKHRGKIGYMPEERGMYKKMKIGEHALYLARLKGLSSKEAMASIKYWFEKLNMESWWNNKVGDLSKGMSQKLQFVSTVIHNPTLIILDEPFSGLDPINANLIKEEIFQLASNGATIIFSTHRMEQVEEICDHIILINKGEKILDSSVNLAKQTFKENKFNMQYTGQLVTPDPAEMDIESQTENEITFKLPEGKTCNNALLHFIQCGNQVQGFQEILPSLNEIFLKLVQGTPTTRQFNLSPS